ncbi:aldose 1-epimerase [Hyphomonas sp. L-53-1-40]|uniref:aldose 1-epimerase n=1 Tax=Hyphomonas sp. L-53-1-40 TaxID=1207058 RepID=UPI000AB8A17B|nr:aldose 1-epimerase [Hyphomonas sp. L-53-1-40]
MADSTALSRLVLQRGALELILLPDLGGSVGGLTYKAQDILRPLTRTADESPLQTAGFPLFPFSGRISEGHFAWQGRDISLAPNFLPEPHAIHGQAWHAAWQVAEHGSDHARLVFDYCPGDWPWAYRAEQEFKLRDDGLHLMLRLTNKADETMPAGLGWHPYFPRLDARVKVPVDRVWMSDEGMIPDRLDVPAASADLSDWRVVAELDLDNAFTVSDRTSRVEWPSRNLCVEMVSDAELGHMVIYTPKQQDFFCVEPVSHAPDAVNSQHPAELTGLHSLAPGETLSAQISLTIRET